MADKVLTVLSGRDFEIAREAGLRAHAAEVRLSQAKEDFQLAVSNYNAVMELATRLDDPIGLMLSENGEVTRPQQAQAEVLPIAGTNSKPKLKPKLKGGTRKDRLKKVSK